MSVVSETHRGNVSISASESPVVIPNQERSPGEISGYKEVLKKHEAMKMSRPNLGKRPKPSLDVS